jgi:inosine-uridine nucleoside N-ribohydrolase
MQRGNFFTPHRWGKDRSIQEQAAVEMLLDLLRSSDEKMVISAVGSARVIAAAINRDRDLVVGKTDFVVLNAGSLSNHMECEARY